MIASKMVLINWKESVKFKDDQSFRKIAVLSQSFTLCKEKRIFQLNNKLRVE